MGEEIFEGNEKKDRFPRRFIPSSLLASAWFLDLQWLTVALIGSDALMRNPSSVLAILSASCQILTTLLTLIDEYPDKYFICLSKMIYYLNDEILQTELSLTSQVQQGNLTSKADENLA